MCNHRCVRVTRLRRAQDENINQAPAAEPAPVQAATISIADANRMVCAPVVATDNHQKVDQEASAKPVAPLPHAVGNSNKTALRRPAHR